VIVTRLSRRTRRRLGSSDGSNGFNDARSDLLPHIG
jgi:hypothetical protein